MHGNIDRFLKQFFVAIGSDKVIFGIKDHDLLSIHVGHILDIVPADPDAGRGTESAEAFVVQLFETLCGQVKNEDLVNLSVGNIDVPW